MDIVIFGISGHLAETKLIPALRNLYQEKKIPDDVRLIGFSRSPKQHEVPFSYEHIVGSYSEHEDFLKLKKILRPNVKQFFYLALPPEASRDVLVSIASSGLVTKEDVIGSRLILAEKPFGTSFADASSLMEVVNESFRADQCLKVDHYAGKKELRELSVESDIRKVIFEILETATVESRGGFYDSVGALRDIGQNHLLFMLATFFKGEGKREEVLHRLSLDPDTSKYVFGHYEGYDKIETFFSIPAILSDLDGDDQTPEIVLRSGKGLSQNLARIWIGFKEGSEKPEKEIRLSGGPVAYETVLLDAFNGRIENFLSDEEVLLSWKFIEEIEKVKETKTFFTYPVGSDEAYFL